MVNVPSPEKSNRDADGNPPTLDETFLLVHLPRLLPLPSTLSALRSMAALLGAWCIAAKPFAARAWALSSIGYERPGPANLLVGMALRAFAVSFAMCCFR